VVFTQNIGHNVASHMQIIYRCVRFDIS
jgi:hypothetical protein